MTHLVVNKLGKTFEAQGDIVTALRGVSFSLARGESLAVVGPSGAGKTTLLNLLGGIDTPTEGEIFLGGERLDGLDGEDAAKFRRNKLGFVFQFHHLLKDFTSLENIAMPLWIAGYNRQAALDKAAIWMQDVGLAGKEKRFPRELSGGEQQRVAIARALVREPELVLADEPTGNLDSKHGESIFDLFVSLSERLSTTLIVVTHHPEFAKKLKKNLRLISGQVEAFL